MSARLGALGVLLLGAIGCANAAQNMRPGSPAACGNRCDAMVCPVGSSCTVDGSCTPRCEPERLPERLP